MALERAASALPDDADAIRPANGDPERLLVALGAVRAPHVLAYLLSNETDHGDELARAWCDSAAGAAAILAVGEEGLSKPGRKVLRRVRHVLRGRGVAVPEPPAPARVATLTTVEPDVSGAWLSKIDPSGVRVALRIEDEPGGVRLFELLLDEGRGIAECAVYAPSRGKARQLVRRAEEARGLALAPVPVDAFRALVARCEAAHPRDRVMPRGFLEFRSHLVPASGAAETPGALAARALGDEPTPEALRRASELVREHQIGPWPPPQVEPLLEAAEKLRSTLESRIVVSEQQRQEQQERVYRDAARAVYGGARAPRTIALLAESAWSFWQLGKDGDARACLAAARALREAPDAEHAPMLALAERLLAPLLARMREAARPEDPGGSGGLAEA